MMNYTSVLLVTAIVVSSASAQSFARRPQLIRFFTAANCMRGSNPPMYNYTENTNLSLITPTFRSYCVVQGAWRVEQHSAPEIFNIAVGDSCTTCHMQNSNAKFGMVRRIGAMDVTQAWLYLYKDGSFSEEGAVVSGWESSFNATYSFTSVAFTSYSNWTWQLYYSPRFRGDSVCLRPNHASEITLLYPHTVNVGSIRQGCRNSGIALGHWGLVWFINIFISSSVLTYFNSQ